MCYTAQFLLDVLIITYSSALLDDCVLSRSGWFSFNSALSSLSLYSQTSSEEEKNINNNNNNFLSLYTQSPSADNNIINT